MILYADFETSTTLIDGKVNVYLWGLVSEDNNIRDFGINLESFFKRIETLEEEPIIYFHNINWDGTFIIHYLLDNGYEFVEKFDTNTRHNTFTWVADYNTNLYNIKVKTRYGVISFLDSIKILVKSVDELGKVLEMPKLKIDYSIYKNFNSKNDVPQELLDYLFRDIDIVKDFMKVFSQKVEKVKTTIASTMYGDFIKHYGIHNFTRDFGSPFGGSDVLTKEEWLKIKLSYNGGFTAIAPRYVGVDIQNIKGYSYDWNSMYPSVMLKYKMPYGKSTPYKIDNDDVELMEIRIIKAIKTDILIPAMLPNGSYGRFLGKYLSECNNTTIYIWKEEWEQILRGYEIDFVHTTSMFFRSKYVFKEFIEKIMGEKINAVNEVERFISKIKQNSLYGKFGQNIERVSKILIKDEKREHKGKRYGEKQDWVEITKITELNNLPYIPIASYITSIARTLLFKTIFDNRENFIYCDTDSLYLTDKAVGIKIDSKEYGCLKLEHIFDRFKAIKLKCYMLNDIKEGKVITKVAGLPEDAQQLLTFDTFYRGYKLEKSKLQKKHHIGGLILEDIDYTL